MSRSNICMHNSVEQAAKRQDLFFHSAHDTTYVRPSVGLPTVPPAVMHRSPSLQTSVHKAKRCLVEVEQGEPRTTTFHDLLLWVDHFVFLCFVIKSLIDFVTDSKIEKW